MRVFRSIWARGGEKPSWVKDRVWFALIDMFDELGPDNFGIGLYVPPVN
jgi:hypothetical protein